MVADETILKYKEWQVPPQAAPEERKLKWLGEACEEGMAWLKSQRGHSDWKRALDVIAGKLDTNVPLYRSSLKTNHLKRNAREIVSTLSKLRPLWGYGSDNDAFKEHAELMNKVVRALYLRSFFDLAIGESLEYAVSTCTGWIRPIYRRDMAGHGRGEVKLLSYGSPCVLPVQLPMSGDYQQAYAVTILDEMPIYMAHGMFPDYQEQLRPTSALYWHSAEIRQSAVGNLWKRIFSFGKSTVTPTNLSDLLVPIRYTYVIDLAINKTGKTIPMGEPGTTWFYDVPSLNSDIPTGRNPNGQVLHRKATENDARLYPHRRLLISSEKCIMYDGPAFDWHGRLPAIPFTLDRWPWEPLGFSVVRDGYDIQLAIDELWRGIVDKLRAQNDMALAYDINSVSSKEAKEFDPMQPRARIGYDGSAVTKPFEMPIPPEVLAVKPEQFTGIEKLKETMDEQLAIKDLMALAKARLAGDQLEKVMEANGPIIEYMSRRMEPPMRELGEQVKYLVLQYLTPAQLMQIVGILNVPEIVADFDPSSLVPSHLPGENPEHASSYDKVHRARTLADNLFFNISPNSLHEYTQMLMKLGLIQLKKAGVLISSQTIAEAWQVRNYGTFDGATEIEKWKSEQEMMLEFAARMKEIGANLPGLAQATQGGPAGGTTKGGSKQQEGRPPSGQASPQLKSKGDGRGTITESQGGGTVV